MVYKHHPRSFSSISFMHFYIKLLIIVCKVGSEVEPVSKLGKTPIKLAMARGHDDVGEGPTEVGRDMWS